MKDVIHIDKNRMQKKELVWIYPKDRVELVIDQSYPGVRVKIRNVDPETTKIISEDKELSEFLQKSSFFDEIYIKQDVNVYITAKDDIISISYENDVKSFAVTIANPVK